MTNKVIFSIILFALLTRIAIPPFLGHPPNFSAIDAMALFCGAYLSRRSAWLVVLGAVWLSDILLNKMLVGHWIFFYSGWYWQYGCYLLITLLGTTLTNRVRPLPLLGITLGASVLFFLVSNFGVWMSGLLYPPTMQGLITCYIAAIPFFKNTICSDLFFSMVFFGSYNLIQITIPKLIYNKF